MSCFRRSYLSRLCGWFCSGYFLPFVECTDLSAARGVDIPGKNPPSSHGESGDRHKTPIFSVFTSDEKNDPHGTTDRRCWRGQGRNTFGKTTPGYDRGRAGISGFHIEISGIWAQNQALFRQDRLTGCFFDPPDREGENRGLYRACF